MCDDGMIPELTAALTRRRFAMAGGMALLAGQAALAGGSPLAEAMVTIRTADGSADAFFVHPATGRHPGIVLWPDIAGLRDAYKQLARRLAAAGYAVLAVNQYYRSARSPVMASFAEWLKPEGRARLQPMIAALTTAAVTGDAAAFIRFLAHQPMVDRHRRMGSLGFCMGGPFAVRTAAAAPALVGAVASFHGAALVTGKADSPDRLIAATRAAFLFAIARGDDARAPGDKDALRAAAKAAHRSAEVTVYPAEHGWCTPDAPSYDAGEAARAWERMLALFKTLQDTRT